MRGFVLMSALFLSASPLHAALHVRLDVTPAVTLPGIPVSLRLTFSNDAPSRPVAVPTQVVLAARGAGERFAAHWEAHNVTPMNGVPREVGRTPVVFEFSTDGSFGVPGWFFDDGLAAAGTYELQLYVGQFTDSMLPLAELIPQASAVSNVAKLTVAEPTGVDAEVWSALKRIAGTEDDWLANDVLREGNAAARDLLARYPDSSYAGWLASMGVHEDVETRAQILRDWLSKHPGDPQFENRMLRVAEWEVFLAHKFSATKPEESGIHELHARGALAKLSNAKSPAVRERVADRLQWLADLHQ
jgi:hypothetical protein